MGEVEDSVVEVDERADRGPVGNTLDSGAEDPAGAEESERSKELSRPVDGFLTTPRR